MGRFRGHDENVQTNLLSSDVRTDSSLPGAALHERKTQPASPAVFLFFTSLMNASIQRLLKNKNPMMTHRVLRSCGHDETRTRDLRRDRPAF